MNVKGLYMGKTMNALCVGKFVFCLLLLLLFSDLKAQFIT